MNERKRLVLEHPTYLIALTQVKIMGNTKSWGPHKLEGILNFGGRKLLYKLTGEWHPPSTTNVWQLQNCTKLYKNDNNSISIKIEQRFDTGL